METGISYCRQEPSILHESILLTYHISSAYVSSLATPILQASYQKEMRRPAYRVSGVISGWTQRSQMETLAKLLAYGINAYDRFSSYILDNMASDLCCIAF
ncbi:hypothetical protein E6O75_ATG03764 [Venturia nashicola]|uniref:Uncharacterized protein n=1 Tax=Venturia nashicola TaxID=86259 RepID=A0A4Z1PJF6_9PEZI|nr:hypothetical protein E6O75_ATG03764 [Venturia nashicola]